MVTPTADHIKEYRYGAIAGDLGQDLLISGAATVRTRLSLSHLGEPPGLPGHPALSDTSVLPVAEETEVFSTDSRGAGFAERRVSRSASG